MQDLSNKLDPLVRERRLGLLEKPYAGSKAFKFNHVQAKYSSDCYGTIAFVFDLQSPLIKENFHPNSIAGYQMEDLIAEYFLPSDKFEIGDLIGFYQKSLDGGEDVLIHIALLVGDNGKIFHQSGSAGIFEPNTIDAKLKSFRADKQSAVDIKSFKRKKAFSTTL